ncbi:MAG: hypothetical protein P4L92_23065 [Rudaea sp.]|nr:hypothetical protein [Rudaea sp.]
MTGKAQVQDITDEGFQAQQFGSSATFLTPNTGYIAVLLNRASAWAAQRVTDTNYAAATAGTYANDCLVRAEIAYVAETLWTRRAAFIDASANISMGDNERAQQIKQFLANSQSAYEDANYWIAEAQRAFGMDPTADMGGTGISTGYIENGHFPQTSPAPLNLGQSP